MHKNVLPKVKVYFHAQHSIIQKIELLEHPEGFQWELLADDPKLNQLISHWIDCYTKHIIPTIELPLNWIITTPFTFTVLKAMQKVPMGTTISYKELAAKVGIPQGARAVGNACGRNPFPFIIPCHRIVRSLGNLGGFSCGINIKKSLLDFERS